MPTAILGISAYYHDSAAALIIDGAIVAAAQEERFSRIKNDARFPDQAIAYVMQEGGIDFDELTSIVFYDKPLLKFERLLETYHAFAPFGLRSFAKAIPIWIKEKLFIKRSIKKKISALGKKDIPVFFAEHHLSHAASAYYPSPFNEAAILTIDGVGEWATTTICRGTGNQIEILKELRFPHSVGLLYASFTYYLGFAINSGEYKLMGLAPYGNPNSTEVSDFKQKILAELVDIREDGSILLNMKCFNFATGLKMTNSKKWELLFGFKRRAPESEIEPQHISLALAIQQVTELIVIKLAKTARDITGCKNLVMAGGVALNCVANSKMEAEDIFDNIWIQPAGGDAGGALGAAYAALFIGSKDKREQPFNDGMQGAYLGPEYTDKDVLKVINKNKSPYIFFEDFADLTSAVSQKIADGKVVGWFQGRMEFGPRALGNRSILGDPRNPEMQNIINTKIKSRESFRPFAPAVLEEDVSVYFTPGKSSPYMLFTAMLNHHLRKEKPANYADFKLYDRLNCIRADIPAVIHVDYSARIQTVSKKTNPRFWQLINDFKNLTGWPMLINTSFNVRDEPIVCTPDDAYKDFITTEMDYLVLGDFLLSKN